MTFAATNSTAEPRSFSIGPRKVQILRYTAVSADTAGTITADALNEVEEVIMDGRLELTALGLDEADVRIARFAAFDRLGHVDAKDGSGFVSGKPEFIMARVAKAYAMLPVKTAVASPNRVL